MLLQVRLEGSRQQPGSKQRLGVSNKSWQVCTCGCIGRIPRGRTRPHCIVKATVTTALCKPPRLGHSAHPSTSPWGERASKRYKTASPFCWGHAWVVDLQKSAREVPHRNIQPPPQVRRPVQDVLPELCDEALVATTIRAQQNCEVPSLSEAATMAQYSANASLNKFVAGEIRSFKAPPHVSTACNSRRTGSSRRDHGHARPLAMQRVRGVLQNPAGASKTHVRDASGCEHARVTCA